MAKRILICDDDIPILRAAHFKLTKAGYQVQTALNGEIGLELIPTFKPDMVITDLQMPCMSGLELVAHLRKNPETAHLPVIVLSAKQLEINQELFLVEYRCSNVLPKPFSPLHLLQCVQSAIGPASSILPAQSTNELTPIGAFAVVNDSAKLS